MTVGTQVTTTAHNMSGSTSAFGTGADGADEPGPMIPADVTKTLAALQVQVQELKAVTEAQNELLGMIKDQIVPMLDELKRSPVGAMLGL